MKKLISLVLAGIMTFSLAACGQNVTDNQTTAQNAQTTQRSEVQPAAATDTYLYLLLSAQKALKKSLRKAVFRCPCGKCAHREEPLCKLRQAV